MPEQVELTAAQKALLDAEAEAWEKKLATSKAYKEAIHAKFEAEEVVRATKPAAAKAHEQWATLYSTTKELRPRELPDSPARTTPAVRGT